MAYILDTHTFLWFVAGDKQLPPAVKDIIKDFDKVCYISIASFWEITIKLQLGKLKSELTLSELFRFAERNQIEIIPINEQHLITQLNLKFDHKDPFDRIIISQALSEKLVLITKDKTFKKYKVKQLWGN